MRQPVKTYTVEEAKRKLEAYCAYQERCHKDVACKLREMRMIPEAIDIIISHLIEHNFLNETRFAQAFARGKFRQKSWGRNRITRELKSRHISAYNLKMAIKEIDSEEYLEVFDTLSRKRYEQLSSESNVQRKRKKLADYLLYRGWESGMVYEKVRELVC
ncbi:regulatory protein RecX [Dokdonia sp. Hel_I_53]|uniref:regulatory protein RecX n=1 Tax=Dokdonia sp. Hel_I_53 TaxID=1566287 RepID=UPI0011A77E09|nr:regulatory protein RecX [Dokdonia sp. Hel_I_53]